MGKISFQKHSFIKNVIGMPKLLNGNRMLAHLQQKVVFFIISYLKATLQSFYTLMDQNTKQNSDSANYTHNNRCCYPFVIICTLCSIAAVWVLSGFWRSDLFYMSAEYIYNLQNPYNEFGKGFFNLVGIFLQIVTGIIIFIVYLVTRRKLNGVVYAIYMIFNIFLIMVTKHAFQDPRPFWVFPQILQLQWGCTEQYGFPSGHSWVSVIVFQPILADFVGYGPFRWATCLLILSAILAPFSRLYIGVHAGDQLVIGLFMSFSMLVLYRFGIQKGLFRYTNACLNKKRKKIALVLLTLFAHACILVVPIIIFQVNLDSRPISSYQLTFLNFRCEKTTTFYELQRDHMLLGSIGSAIFGVIYGLLIASRSKHEQFWRKYYFGQWHYGKKRRVVFKIILYLILVGFWIGIFLFLIPRNVENAYGAYFSFCFGMMMSGFTITYIVPKIAHKLHIVNMNPNEQNIPQPPLTNQRFT